MDTRHSHREQASQTQHTILLEDARAEGAGRSLLFADPLEWLEVRTLDEIPALFRRLEEARREGRWAAGYLAYECGFHFEPSTLPLGWELQADELPLAAFGIYRTPLSLQSEVKAGTTRRGASELEPDRGDAWFAEAVGAIHRAIETGDTYQANLTLRLEGTCDPDAAALFAHMMDRQPVAFGAMLRIGERVLLSASPELFFRLEGGAASREITVRPMKGTAPRGRDAAEDDRAAAALAGDEKNRAENIMIVDLLRSDLGRIAAPGTVRVSELFAVERLPSLLQMSSEVRARLRAEVDSYALFRALFPCGSIVGAPKVRTMEILRAIERRDRGVYTGAIGYFAPDGEAVFSVAIRTAVCQASSVSMGVGAGITYSSEAADEYRECLLKGAFLREPDFQLIETMRWEAGKCLLLERHMERLARSAGYFGFHWDRARVEAALSDQAAGLDPGAWKLRLLLFADGRLSLSPPEPIVAEPGSLRAMLWLKPLSAADPFLGHKTTKRAVYDQAARAARDRGFVDAIFQNEHGMVAEGALHSVLVRHGDQWRTPPLRAGALPGVSRAHLLATMTNLREADVPLEALLDAAEVWLVNAVRGIRRVRVEAPCKEESLPLK